MGVRSQRPVMGAAFTASCVGTQDIVAQDSSQAAAASGASWATCPATSVRRTRPAI